MPQIEVSFDIDANGIVHVSAKDLGTGKEQKISLTGSSGLDKSEVERMVQEAEDHGEEDRAAREAADARNRADQLVYQVDKTLKDNGDKFGEDDRKPVDEALQAARDALEKGDVEQIKATTEQLEKVSHRLAELIYKADPAAAQQAAAGAAGAPGADAPGSGPAGSDSGEVIDAEVVDVEETKSS